MSRLLLTFSLVCIGMTATGLAEEQTTHVVNRKWGVVYFVKDGNVEGSDFLPQGTKIRCERIEENFCHFTHDGKPAFMRLSHLEGPAVLPGTVVVKKPEENLSAQERFRRAQQAKGLVEYEGQWVTPEEK